MTALAEAPDGMLPGKQSLDDDGPDAPRDLPRVRAILKQFRVVDTDYRAKGVRRLAKAFREHFNLPPATEAEFERPTCWKAMVFRGRVIAVFGEVWHSDRLMEISDAYSEPTRYGHLAVYAQAMTYKDQVDRGIIDEVDFLILTQNEAAVRAVVKETKTPPWAMIWRYRKP